ncbi:hypothetical protein SDC9_166034 [bioreactor metagenome]|uniref:Uncharacterized protein n=1 Tax=bioreactor metagenome TaxID=1076179 RepID=A0A645FVX0_9ZZZZ
MEVFRYHPLDGAAVLFRHGHFSVDDLHAGVQLQKICPDGGDGIAAPAFFHIVQPVQHKADLQPVAQAFQLRNDFLRRAILPRHPRRPQGKLADAHRQVGGIHHVDAPQFLRRNSGVLMAAGKTGAQIDVDDRVIFLQQFAEQLVVIRRIYRAGGGDVAAGVHMGGNVRRMDVHAVLVDTLAFYNAQRHHRDIVFLQQGDRQVAGAVRGNFNHGRACSFS